MDTKFVRKGNNLASVAHLHLDLVTDTLKAESLRVQRRQLLHSEVPRHLCHFRI